MKAKTRLMHWLAACVILSACVPVASAEPTALPVTPTATEKPQVTETSVALTAVSTATEEPQRPGYYPLSTRTGIVEVDKVLAAVESGDAQALRELIHFTQVSCTNADGLGGPPKCRAGETDGTLINVLPFLGPEGSFIPEAEIANFQPMNMLGIYAVYAVSASAYAEAAYPAGAYAVMLTTKVDQLFVVYQIRDGIVRIDTVFSPTTRDMVIQRDAAELILAPK